MQNRSDIKPKKVIGGLFLLALLRFIILICLGFLSPLLKEVNSDLPFLFDIVLSVLIFLFLFRFYKAFLDKGYREPFFKTSGSVSEKSFLYIGCAVCVTLFFSYVVSLLIGLLNLLGVVPVSFDLNFPGNKIIFSIYVVYIVFIGPVFEELFFRGFFFDVLKKAGVSKKTMVFLSAFIFGILHMGFQGVFVAFLAGIVLGVLALSEGGLLLSTGFHIANNALAYIASQAVQYPRAPFTLFLVLIMILCAVFGLVFLINKRKIYMPVLTDDKETVKLKTPDVLSVPFLLCVVITVLFMAGIL